MNPRLKKLQIGLTFTLLAAWIVGGCGVGRTFVVKPAEMKLRAASVTAVETDSTVPVPADLKAEFQEKLTQLLYEEGAFQKGTDLKIEYRYIQFDPGNQFTRWFWGGIGNAGEGSLMIETKYFDGAGHELSTIQTEGRIGSGVFGGDFSLALQKAAEKIAEYTKVNFK